jgi:hypothetical protein
MKTKEQWIDETMESLEGITQAKADPALFGRLQHLIVEAAPGRSMFPTRLLWKVAAGLALLITMNIVSYVQYNKSSDSGIAGDPIASEYFTYIETIKF